MVACAKAYTKFTENVQCLRPKHKIFFMEGK